MVGPTKKKLCWNCEGSVSLQEENCPYCGVYLSPSVGEEGMQEQIEELFDPPYRINEEGRSDVPTSPFPVEANLQLAEEVRGNDLKKIVLPLSMLLSGTVFFLFGLALFLFSRQGVERRNQRSFGEIDEILAVDDLSRERFQSRTRLRHVRTRDIEVAEPRESCPRRLPVVLCTRDG